MDGAARHVHNDHVSLKESKGPLANNPVQESLEENSTGKENDKNSDRNSLEKSPVCDSERRSLRASPEPSCAICLGKLENKSFTDSCFHTFCFTCLLEWSKVKAECPLCKQPFKSIVHNVRSIEDYDQYYINSRISVSSWQSPDGRRFRYPSTLTAERRRQISLEQSIEYHNHRLTYAPHSLHSSASRNVSGDHPSTSNFRRRIYENGLWVSPLGTGNTSRYRDTSPEFYRQNPACTHRLIPWLNRELIALLYDSESQVTFVLELILALIMRYDIRSQEFYVHIQPYIQDRTSHFIHEFYNYARSPCDMSAYDHNAVYEHLESLPENQSVTSTPGSDVIALPSGDSPNEELPSTSNPSQDIKHDQNSEAQNTECSPRTLTKLFLIRNHENDTWQSMFEKNSFNSTHLDSDSSSSATISYARISSPQSSALETDLPGPSTSSGSRTSKRKFKTSNHSDSDCIVINVIQPKHKRTPEVIDLISSSCDETDNVITETVIQASFPKKKSSKTVDEKLDKHTSFKRKKCSESRKSNCKSRVRSSINKKNHPKSQWASRYSSEHSTRSRSSVSRRSSVHHSKDRSRSRSRSYSKSLKSCSPPSRSPSSSPHRSRRRSQSRHKHRNDDYHLDSSTDISYSEDDFKHTSSYSKDAKLKVRSVVWQFSTHHHFSSSGKSHHLSSNKRHKEKKKKKHKHRHHHSHKHKQYSSSSDTD